MQTNDIAKAFLSSSCFKGLELKQIEKLIAVSKKIQFKANDLVYAAGEPSKEILFLIHGKVEIAKGSVHLALISEGNIVGEMGVLTKQPRSANVKAISDIQAISFPQEELEKVITNNPELALILYRNLVGILSEHLRNNNLMLELSDIIDETL